MTFDDVLKLLDLTPLDLQMIPLGALLFVLVWRGLTRYFLTPYLRLLEAREQSIHGAQDAAVAIEEQARAVRIQYETQLLNVRSAAMQAKNERLAVAKKEAQQIVDQAQAGAQERLKTLRAEIAQRITALRNQSESEAEMLANSVVERVLSISQQH